jgi:conjugative transfer signal peptidase TraF
MRMRALRTSRGIRFCVIAIALLMLVAITYRTGIRLNLSSSIPLGIYRITDGPIERGSIVLVCLPPNVSFLARSRGYITNGSCADGTAPIGKPVVAASGDEVDLNAKGIRVNGKLLANSRALSVDAKRRVLRPYPAGMHHVTEDELWLVSSYSLRSFDSRYFGPIRASSVIAQVRPLFMFQVGRVTRCGRSFLCPAPLQREISNSSASR